MLDPNDDSAERTSGNQIFILERTLPIVQIPDGKCTTRSAHCEHVECTKLQRNELGGAVAPKNELEDELIWIIMNKHDKSWIFTNKIGI